MTCVVGLAHKGQVYMGADSAASDGQRIEARREPKVVRRGAMLLGYAGSVRIGQLLRYAPGIPQPPSSRVARWIALGFVAWLRKVLSEGGALEDKATEIAADIMVGTRGGLWTIEADYQVGSTGEGYAAIGNGSEVALGALYATRGQRDARARVQTALTAAERYCVGVRRPLRVRVI